MIYNGILGVSIELLKIKYTRKSMSLSYTRYFIRGQKRNKISSALKFTLTEEAEEANKAYELTLQHRVMKDTCRLLNAAHVRGI